MKRFFWILGIGLLALIIIVALGIGLYIGPIAKIGIQDVGPTITRVAIKVDSVDVSLLTGSAKVKGLIVGNPSGYNAPQAISVGTIAVSVDPFSVMSDKIMVHSIQVESPEITFQGGLGGNNLSKILGNVDASSKNSAPAPTQGNNKPAPKIEVDDLLITNAKIHVSLTGLVTKSLTLPLPEIHLTDLGKGSNGFTPAELIRAILEAITTGTVKAVAGSATDLGQGVQTIGQGAQKTVSDSVNKITGSIGGLFGK